MRALRHFRIVAVGALALAALAAGTVAAQGAGRFSDVPPDHEHAGAVEWAASAGVT